MNKRIIIGIICFVILVLATVAIVFYYNKTKKTENGWNEYKPDSKVKTHSLYKIKLNNKEVNLNSKLSNFTDDGFVYANISENGFENIKMNGWYMFGKNTEGLKDYGLPRANQEESVPLLDLNLFFGSESRKYSDVIVDGVRGQNVSSEFFSINGIGCGNTLDEAILALKINKESEYYQTSSESSLGQYIEYVDVDNNIKIEIGVRKDKKIYVISIMNTNHL